MTSFLILEGDVLEQFKEIDSNCIDAIPTDPPYNVGMDKWDKWPTNQLFGDWCFEWGKEAFRVLKPGGTIFVFGSSRTYHWMACALEKAGFTTIDMIEWVYWGTMPRKSKLKSCHEPIYVGSKGKHRGFNTEELRIPFDKKIKQVAETILLPNIPEGKHPGRSAYAGTTKTKKYKNALDDKPYQMNENGRHPYNIVTTTMVEAVLFNNVIDIKKPRGQESIKHHQTQKPISLMKWLIQLSTSPEDLVLDCFGGTGTTGKAALECGRKVILIEKEPTYVELIKSRLG